MKKVTYSVIFLFGLFLSACSLQKPVVSEQFQDLSRNHQKIAILPFDVLFNEEYQKLMAGRNNKARTKEYWADLSRFAGLAMQKELFMGIAKQVSKGKYEFVVQDFLTTNQILESNKVPFYLIAKADKQALARLLGVDAVIWGQLDVIFSPMGFRPGEVRTSLLIYDERTGQKVWENSLSATQNNPRDTPEDLARNAMSQMARMLPYKQH